MSVLLETTVGDVVIDLDLTGSPNLCRNFLKLCQARYYTNTLIYNVQANRFCQAGDPCGDGSGGASIYGVMDMEANVKQSTKRFIPSHGRLLSTAECRERGRVVMTEMNGIPDTIGSQFLITLAQGEGSGLDGYNPMGGTDRAPGYLSLGQVAEDDGAVLDAIHAAYCDAKGRPYADIRIVGAWVLHDPFPDPDGMDALLQRRGASEPASPHCERPPEELVERRIGAEQIDAREEETPQQRREREEEQLRKEAKSRAVVLEMLGDLPDAEIAAPENVLFVCKLNPITQDDDLELIFSRFDSQCKADIIRDPDSGKSLCYAFVEFHDKQQCVEAYFKMNNALVDDRRIKVDFSQSVAKVWGTFHQQGKAGGPKNMPRLDFADVGSSKSGNQRRGDRGGGEHRGGRGFDNRPPQQDLDYRHRRGPPASHPEQFHHERQDRPQHSNRADRHRDTRHNNNNNNDDDDISNRDGEPVRRDRAERRDRIDSSDDSRERESHRKKEHKKRNKEDDRYDDERKRDGDDDRKRRRDGDDRKERSSSGRRRHDDQGEEKRHRKKDRGAEDDDDDRRRRRKHHRHSEDQERHRKHSKKHRKRSRSGDRGAS